MNVPQMPRMWMCMGADYPGTSCLALGKADFRTQKSQRFRKSRKKDIHIFLVPFCDFCVAFATFASGSPPPYPYLGNRSRNFSFQNLPVDVRGTASMNS
jgi:hypothetical protein